MRSSFELLDKLPSFRCKPQFETKDLIKLPTQLTTIHGTECLYIGEWRKKQRSDEDSEEKSDDLYLPDGDGIIILKDGKII